MSRKIEDFEIVDHGLENPQYFQGCGVSFTEFVTCSTGIGDNPAEALDDALDSLAQEGWDTEGNEELQKRIARINKRFDGRNLVEEFCEKEGFDYEESELTYYISIRVK